jgi:signal-transduction protein with cAMP-binding, CBS, and nucleotidyltransferase domain
LPGRTQEIERYSKPHFNEYLLPCSFQANHQENGAEERTTMSQRNRLDVLLKKIRGKEGNIIPVLRTIPIFEGLTFRDLKKIELIVHERTFMPDEVIFYERQPGTGMYFVKKGLVRLTKTVNGERIKIAELAEGEFFGEMSLLEEYPRSAQATAVVKTDALGIFRPDLLDLIKRHPRLGTNILIKLSTRLASRLRKTTEMKVKEVE